MKSREYSAKCIMDDVQSGYSAERATGKAGQVFWKKTKTVESPPVSMRRHRVFRVGK